MPALPRALLLPLLLGLVACAAPAPAPAPPPERWALPLAEADARVDQWLRRASATYARMVREIRERPDVAELRIVERPEVAQAAVAVREGRLEVQLNPALRGAQRVTLIAFEVANAYRAPEHQAIDRAVDQGLITTAAEFGLAHELYEYEALRLHRQVLTEVEERTGPLPPDMFLTTPPPPSARASRLPDLVTYLETQRRSGHTAHYERWFARRARPEPARQGK
ncbi:MAG: hypothetical protein AB7N76_10665 [Planctomycetota bacterium]